MVLNFKPFFIHKFFHNKKLMGHCPSAAARGFTAYIAPSEKPRTINLQIVMCAPQDGFCRKIGREQVMLQEVHEINPRDLPQWLAEAETYYRCGSTVTYIYPASFEWVWKYLF